MGNEQTESLEFMPKAYEKIKKRIEHIFNDNSFPRVVFLDGDWGSGKTYFLRNFFSNQKNENVIYVSLLGVNSLESFMKKVYSLSMFGSDSDPAKKTEKFIGKSLETISAITESEAVKKMGNILSAGSALLSTLIDAVASNQFENKILIVDDVERVDFSLFTLITGECYTLADDQRRNIRVILVGNKKNMDSFAFSIFMEKIVMHQIYFSLERDDAMDIIVSYIKKMGWETLSDFEVQRLFLALSIGPIRNLRVLKRIVYCYVLY